MVDTEEPKVYVFFIWQTFHHSMQIAPLEILKKIKCTMSYDSFLKRQVLEKFCNDKFHLTIHSDVTKTHIVFERHRSSLTFIAHHKVAIHLLSNVMQYNMCLLVLRWYVPQLCPRRGFQTHHQEPSPPSGDKYFVSTVKEAWALNVAGLDYV